MKICSVVSVIIPTYNRKDSVLRTLDSLKWQTLPTDRYEVIVVDDGSQDDTEIIAGLQFPFTMRYLRQENQGATVARNRGARRSQADVLVFIDDDVTISPHTLEALAEACNQKPRVLAMGTLIHRRAGEKSVFAETTQPRSNRRLAGDTDEYIHFTECNTELLSVKRDDFFEIGLLQDPTNGRGWPNWDDVDFGYRAYRQGFKLLRSARAIGEHWDYSLADLNIACRRWQRASKSAVRLFQTHPDLQPHIRMFYDKTPIVWGQDPPQLVIRKLARHIASSRPILGGMEQLVDLLEQRHPSTFLLRPLYRWISGGYMLRGYREGLREYGVVGRRNEDS